MYYDVQNNDLLLYTDTIKATRFLTLLHLLVQAPAQQQMKRRVNYEVNILQNIVII